MKMRIGRERTTSQTLPPSHVPQLHPVSYIEHGINWNLRDPEIEVTAVDDRGQLIMIRMSPEAARSLGKNLMNHGDVALLATNHLDYVRCQVRNSEMTREEERHD